jgi:tetratricopeptide (TPR) repeat protein
MWLSMIFVSLPGQYEEYKKQNWKEVDMKSSRISLSIILVSVIYAATASIALANDDIDSQIKHYTHELKTAPKSVALLIKRGDLYFKLHEFDMAIADYTAAIKLDAHADKAYYGRGLALGRNGNIAQGIKDLSIYISRHPTESYAYTKRGIRYLWLREDSKAKSDLTKAITLAPRNAEAHDDLGVVLARGGDYRGALKNFLACVTIDPTYFKGFNNLAIAYYVMGQDKLALAAVNQSLKLVPDQRSPMLLKAKIVHGLGREKEAAQVQDDAEFLPEGNWSEHVPVK